MAKKILLNRLATFGAVAILSGLLLMIYPFYPLYIAIVIALALGAVSLEFPNIGLILAILLSVLGAKRVGKSRSEHGKFPTVWIVSGDLFREGGLGLRLRP